MSAKVIYAIALAFLATASAVFGQEKSASAASRPNIVLFIADDMTFEDCGPYGATDVRTPNLDKLATESIKFERAFAASPTCTPSRSALYSGLYPFRNGAHANHSLVKDGLRTLPHYMKELGYRVVLAGKSHIGPRPEFPFEYLENGNIMPPGKKELLWTDLNTAAIDAMLQSHDKKQPLCLIVAAHSPHVFWLPNESYNPKTIHLPTYFVDTTKTRRERCNYYTDVTWMDKQVGEVRDSLAKHGYADNTLFMFTADQGAQWPFAKWNLYDAGIHTPLLIHWPGKIDKAKTTSAMVSLVDLLPTMIEAAGGSAPKDIDGQSILPVLLGKTDHARNEIYASHTGDKEMNHAPMRCIRTDRYKYIINLAPQVEYTTHISKTGGPDGYWQSWVNRAKTDPHAAALVNRYEHRPAEELYDLQADPYELKNLATDPSHAKELGELREKVKAWRVQQGEDLNTVPMPEDARSGPLKYAG
ncbi:MAG TPA: sulfatase [Tepidisphaeraceae bacterium]|nr:sulfatase [Tepidisphaeraceae bacterium]